MVLTIAAFFVTFLCHQFGEAHTRIEESNNESNLHLSLPAFSLGFLFVFAPAALLHDPENVAVYVYTSFMLLQAILAIG